MKDYYQILGVKPDSSLEQIKETYRKLVKIYHPDSGGNTSNEDRFKDLNEAYHILSDAKSRNEYDQKRNNSTDNAKRSDTDQSRTQTRQKYRPYTNQDKSQQAKTSNPNNNTQQRNNGQNSYSGQQSSTKHGTSSQNSNSQRQTSSYNKATKTPKDKVKLIFAKFIWDISGIIGYIYAVILGGVSLLLVVATLLAKIMSSSSIIVDGSLTSKVLGNIFILIKGPRLILGWAIFGLGYLLQKKLRTYISNNS